MTDEESNLAVQEYIFREYQKGQNVFDPGVLAASNLCGTPTQIMMAISNMVERNALRPLYLVICDSGHIIYSDQSEERAEDALGNPCTKCPRDAKQKNSYLRCVYGAALGDL